jgi:hypothetical protein
MMSADILNQIDDVIERNRQRFDPLGEAWDDDRVYQLDNSMRVVPARTGIDEEAVEPEAVAQSCRPMVTDCGCPNIGVSATCVTCGWWSCRDHMWDAHDCHAVEPAYWLDGVEYHVAVPGSTEIPPCPGCNLVPCEDGRCACLARVDGEGHTRLEVLPPPVDAALEPDDAERIEMVEAPEDSDENVWGDSAFIPDKSRWSRLRRILPGGTR